MESHPYTNWKRLIKGTISVLYLLLFAMFEAYSAAATALDRQHAVTSWEPRLGWVLFILPSTLIASLFLLRGRQAGLGFTLVVMNLFLYAGFFVFETVASDAQPSSKGSMWEVWGIWSALFVTAILAAHFLKSKTPPLRS